MLVPPLHKFTGKEISLALSLCFSPACAPRSRRGTIASAFVEFANTVALAIANPPLTLIVVDGDGVNDGGVTFRPLAAGEGAVEDTAAEACYPRKVDAP